MDDNEDKQQSRSADLRRYLLALIVIWTVGVAASLGCAYYDPAVPCSIDELMTQADKRMYEGKQNKKSIA